MKETGTDWEVLQQQTRAPADSMSSNASSFKAKRSWIAERNMCSAASRGRRPLAVSAETPDN